MSDISLKVAATPLLSAFVLLLLATTAASMSHERFPFVPIVARKGGAWTGGKRLAVYIKVSVEDFPFGAGGPALVPGLPPPDIMNFGWREYGNRVGVFKLLEDLNRLGLPACFAVNTLCYETCPAVLDTIRANGRHEVSA